MLARVHLTSLIAPAILGVEVVWEEMDADEELKNIRDALLSDPDRHPNFSLVQGNLLYRDYLVLSANSSLIPAILHTYHDLVSGGY